MIAKKVAMLGMWGVGKTSLVQQFVHSLYDEKYHTTLGVKVDKKVVDLDDGTTVNLMLWDIAGACHHGRVRLRELEDQTLVLVDEPVVGQDGHPLGVVDVPQRVAALVDVGNSLLSLPIQLYLLLYLRPVLAERFRLSLGHKSGQVPRRPKVMPC